MKKAARIHPGFGNVGGTLEATLASIFVDDFLKGKDEAYNLNELAGMTAAPSRDAVLEALMNLYDHGLIVAAPEITDDWSLVGTFRVHSPTFTLSAVQGSLDLEDGKAPRPQHDRSMGTDSCVIAGEEYKATLHPLPPEPGPFKLEVERCDPFDDNPERQVIYTAEFGDESGGSESVLKAWEAYDEFIDGLKKNAAEAFTADETAGAGEAACRVISAEKLAKKRAPKKRREKAPV